MVPEAWNGELVVYAHGFVDDDDRQIRAGDGRAGRVCHRHIDARDGAGLGRRRGVGGRGLGLGATALGRATLRLGGALAGLWRLQGLLALSKHFSPSSTRPCRL